MWIILIAFAAVAGLTALCAITALLWLGRTLRWATLDDDQLDSHTTAGRTRFGWLSFWRKPKHSLLTYRRDRLGRFRRHRR